MVNNNKSVEVSYNVQAAVDAENNLVVDFKVTQKPNDQGELFEMAQRAKEILGCDELEVLADKGYHQGEDLKKCAENNIVTYVASQAYSNGTGNTEYYKDKFIFDKEKNIYICPQGKELKCCRSRKSNEKGIIGYDYRSPRACKNCPVMSECTGSQAGRSIFRSINQDIIDEVDERTKNNPEKYKRRQTIVEPVFGVIKRAHNCSYLLTRGKEMAACEVGLFFFAYNFKRTLNILGAAGMLQKLRERRKKAA